MDMTDRPNRARVVIPPLIRRNTLFFAASQALVGAAIQMVPTLAPLMVVRLLGSASLAGIGFSILAFGRLISAYPFGKLADAYGRRVGLLLGLFLGLVGALLTGLAMLAGSFVLFLGGSALFGIGAAAAQQMRVAAADMYPPSRRAEGLGYVFMGAFVGALGGPLLITVAQSSSRALALDPLALSWFLVPAVIVPGMVMVFLVRPDPRDIAAHLERYYPDLQPGPPPHSMERDDSDARQVGVLAFLRRYPQLVAFVASFAANGNMAMMMAMTSLALDHHGHSLPAISLSVAIHVVGMFGFSLPLGRLADRAGRRFVLLMGLLLAGAGSLLVPTSAHYWVITAGTFLVGLGWSGVNVAATAVLADTSAPLERGRVIGTNDTFTAVAGVALPLMGGPIVELLGLPALGLLGAALMFPPLLMLLRLRESTPGRYAHAPTAA